MNVTTVVVPEGLITVLTSVEIYFLMVDSIVVLKVHVCVELFFT